MTNMQQQQQQQYQQQQQQQQQQTHSHQRSSSSHPPSTRCIQLELAPTPPPPLSTVVTAAQTVTTTTHNHYDSEDNNNNNHYYHYSAKPENDNESDDTATINKCSVIRNNSTCQNDGNNVIRETTKYQKRVFRYPAADPKLFANHLVWNNNKKTAEPVDDELDNNSNNNNNNINSNNEAERDAGCFQRVTDFSPINRARSPSGNANCVYADLAESTTAQSQSNGQHQHLHYYHHHPNHHYGPIITTESNNNNNEFKNIYSKVAETSNKQQHESGKALNLSENETSESIPSVTLRTSFSSRNKQQNGNSSSFKRDLPENEYCLSTSADSCLNEPVFDNETLHGYNSDKYSSKVVGGVKVFPGLPSSYDYKQAADMRRSRLCEIEQKLAEIEKSNQLRKHSVTRVHHDHHVTSAVSKQCVTNEIIDLTSSNVNQNGAAEHRSSGKKSGSNSKQLDMNKILYGSSVSVNNAGESGGGRSVPIQVNTKGSARNEQEMNAGSFKHEKKSSSASLKTCGEEQQRQQQVIVNGNDLKKMFFNKSEDKQKGNSYVYYYDNSEHFCGY
jgi:hypothetical protein